MRKRYRLKGSSPYFEEKYGTCNPVVEVVGTDRVVMGVGWQDNTAAIAWLYGKRREAEHLPLAGLVLYVKVERRAAELVHESELGEELDDEGAHLTDLSPVLEPIGATV
jgi:hypothetical protein